MLDGHERFCYVAGVEHDISWGIVVDHFIDLEPRDDGDEHIGLFDVDVRLFLEHASAELDDHVDIAERLLRGPRSPRSN